MQQTFKSLHLRPELLSALADLGYESPSPIQAQGIPVLLEGRDILAQAQTGTGKTATFALPILTSLDIAALHPQALIITPTRELAIQVAEAFKSYAKHLKGFHVLPIYGGQDYSSQLKALKRGVHVIVGTPGRIMDHLRRGTLALDRLKTLVLDEADEMLKMGFIEDVEWILEHIPKTHQTALFSATMPPVIQKIISKYTKQAAKIHIQPDVKTVAAIDQYYILVANNNKLETLTRFLEMEAFNAAIIFARTKNATTELAQKLEARGYAVAALNGDLNQTAREKVIQRLKQNTLDIVVATEVAARGLDVERLSLVINYDIPYDPESYVHRIGRTGRAGRSGKALLFVTPRESHMLKTIEQMIKKRMIAIDPPSAQQISQKRIAEFNKTILATIAQKNLDEYRSFLETLAHESEHAMLDIAAALVFIAQQGKPLAVKETQDLTLKTFEKKPPRKKSSQTTGRYEKGSPSRKRPEGKRPAGRPKHNSGRGSKRERSR